MNSEPKLRPGFATSQRRAVTEKATGKATLLPTLPTMPTMSLWTLGSVGWLVDWLADARAQFVDWCVSLRWLVGWSADLQAQIVDCCLCWSHLEVNRL